MWWKPPKPPLPPEAYYRRLHWKEELDRYLREAEVYARAGDQTRFQRTMLEYELLKSKGP
jgi:hypothetical protein